MIPYLCGGTFFTQLLRAMERTTTPNDRLKGQKEDLREQDGFRRLLSIYRLVDIPAPRGDTLKTYASDFKKCKDSKATYSKFTDSDCRMAFDRDVRSGNSKALSMMSKFVEEALDDHGKEQAVRCLLGLIKDDESIQPDDEFCILPNGGFVSRSNICNLGIYYIEPFLLGVWHFVIINRAEQNELGADTYKSWYPKRDDYRGNVGSGIKMPINVKSADVKEQEEPIEADEVFESQVFSTHDEHGQTINNYDIKIKNNIQGNTIHTLMLS